METKKFELVSYRRDGYVDNRTRFDSYNEAVNAMCHQLQDENNTYRPKDFEIVEAKSELEELSEKVLKLVNTNDKGDASIVMNTTGDVGTIMRKSTYLPLCSSTLKSIVELMEQNNDFCWWVDSNCNVNIAQKINY